MTLSLDPSAKSKSTSNIVDLTDSVPDIAANLIYGSQYHHLPSDIFEALIVQLINDLIDDLASDPQKYLEPHHETQIDLIAQDYLNS